MEARHPSRCATYRRRLQRERPDARADFTRLDRVYTVEGKQYAGTMGPSRNTRFRQPWRGVKHASTTPGCDDTHRAPMKAEMRNAGGRERKEARLFSDGFLRFWGTGRVGPGMEDKTDWAKWQLHGQGRF